MVVAGRLAINPDLEANALLFGIGTKDKVQIARTEAEGNLAIGLVENRLLGLNRPIAGERPFVETQFGRGIILCRIAAQAVGRYRALSTMASS